MGSEKTTFQQLVDGAIDDKGNIYLPDGRFFSPPILHGGGARMLRASDGSPLGMWGKEAAYGFSAALLEKAHNEALARHDAQADKGAKP